jgi:hypothetical protein
VNAAVLLSDINIILLPDRGTIWSDALIKDCPLSERYCHLMWASLSMCMAL